MTIEDNRNQGIVVSGGSLTANDIAVGHNASINKSPQIDSYSISDLNKLKEEVAKLIQIMETSRINNDKIDAAKIAEKELENKEPNLLVVNSVLNSVIDSIKTVETVVGSALSVKRILDLLVF